MNYYFTRPGQIFIFFYNAIARKYIALLNCKWCLGRHFVEKKCMIVTICGISKSSKWCIEVKSALSTPLQNGPLNGLLFSFRKKKNGKKEGRNHRHERNESNATQKTTGGTFFSSSSVFFFHIFNLLASLSLWLFGKANNKQHTRPKIHDIVGLSYSGLIFFFSLFCSRMARGWWTVAQRPSLRECMVIWRDPT